MSEKGEKIAKKLSKSTARTVLRELKDGTYVVGCVAKDEERVKKVCDKLSAELDVVIKVIVG